MRKLGNPVWRPLLAAAIAPFAAPVVISLWMGVQLFITGGLPAIAELSPYLEFVFLVGAPVAFAATWCLGLPLALWLRARQALSSPAICTSSLVFGALTMLALMASIGGLPPTFVRVLATSGLGAALGLSVAIAFCLLAGIPFRRAR